MLTVARHVGGVVRERKRYKDIVMVRFVVTLGGSGSTDWTVWGFLSEGFRGNQFSVLRNWPNEI